MTIKETILHLIGEEQEVATKTIAHYGGGFKPPHKGHFSVVERALKENPDIDEFIITIGKPPRDGVTQEQSKQIWEIYKKHLPYKVKLDMAQSPISSIYRYAKEHPQEDVLWVIGAREGNEEDFKDISNRTSGLSNKPNIRLATIITANTVSGTAARIALSHSSEKFNEFLPSAISDEDKSKIFGILQNSKITETLSEYGNEGPSSPISYLITGKKYKEIPFNILNKVSNLTYDMGGGEISHYDEKNVVVVDNMSVEEFIEHNEINKKIYINYNLNKSYTFPKAKKIIISQLVYHLDNIGAFAKTVNNSLKEGGVIEFLSDIMSKPDKQFLIILQEKYGFYLPYGITNSNLSKSKGDSLKITKTAPPTPDLKIFMFEVENVLGEKAIIQYRENLKPKYVEETKIQGNIPDEVFLSKGKPRRWVYHVIDDIEKNKLPGTTIHPDGEWISERVNHMFPEFIDQRDFVKIKKLEDKVEVFDLLKNSKVTEEIIEEDEGLDRKGLQKLSQRYRVGLDKIIDKLLKGAKIELGSTENEDIALDHSFNMISKDLNYYDKYNVNEDTIKERRELPQEKFARETGKDWVEKALSFYKKSLGSRFDFNDYEVKVLDLNKVKPTQFGEDYWNASSQAEARYYKDYIEGRMGIDDEDFREEDFYPIIINADTYEIIDGNHRHAVHKHLNISKIKAILLSPISLKNEQVNNYITESLLKEEVENLDILPYIAPLTKFMEQNGLVFKPYPKLKIINDDVENGKNPLGDTAYYDPNNNIIVLYTYKRHPKDILRSYAHELIHVYQNVEDRLNAIGGGTDVNKDDELEKIEREAYETGNILFRKWTNSLNENLEEEKEQIKNTMVVILSRENNELNLYDISSNQFLGIINIWNNEVTGVAAEKGYGPLMYELGMAYVYPKSLQSDRRGNTEPGAEKVWMKFVSGLNPNVKVEKLSPTDPDFKTKYPNGTEVHHLNGFFNYKFYYSNKQPLNKLIDKGNKLSDEDRNKIIKLGVEFYSNKVTEGKKIKKDLFGLNAFTMELARLAEDDEEGEFMVYLDMDGVIADFAKRMKQLSGLLPDDFESKYGKEKFWDFIDIEHKVKFWVGIPLMDGAKNLVSYLEQNVKYELLTAPSRNKASLIGKDAWVKKQVGVLFPSKPKINFKFAKQKHEVKSNLTNKDILIDDKKSSIDTWNAKGGTGIHYTSAIDTIKQLKQIGI